MTSAKLLLLVLASVAAVAGAAGLAVAMQARNSTTDTMTSGCFRYSVRTDHSTYRRGAPVTVVVTRTNVTTHSCTGRSCGGVTPWYRVFNAQGRAVYTQSAVGIQCVRNPPPPAVIRPGRAEVWTQGPWDQRDDWTGPCKPGDCHLTRNQVPPGIYRISWRWLDAVSVSTAWFTITS